LLQQLNHTRSGFHICSPGGFVRRDVIHHMDCSEQDSEPVSNTRRHRLAVVRQYSLTKQNQRLAATDMPDHQNRVRYYPPRSRIRPRQAHGKNGNCAHSIVECWGEMALPDHRMFHRAPHLSLQKSPGTCTLLVLRCNDCHRMSTPAC
jgi:hypothetical protein